MTGENERITRRRGAEQDTDRNDSLINDTEGRFAILVNVIDKGNSAIVKLLKELIKITSESGKIQKDTQEQLHQMSDKILETITTNATTMTERIANNLDVVQSQSHNTEKAKLEASKAKRNLKTFWSNNLNSRKQAYWQHHRAKRIADTFENLLAMEPPRMPRKFLPRIILNEDPEDLKFRKELAIDKFKNAINLHKQRSEKYHDKYCQIDEKFVSYITSHYQNDICQNLLKEWEQDCEKEEEISARIFDEKEHWFLNNSESEFRNDNKYRRENHNNNSQNNYRNNGGQRRNFRSGRRSRQQSRTRTGSRNRSSSGTRYNHRRNDTSSRQSPSEQLINPQTETRNPREQQRQFFRLQNRTRFHETRQPNFRRNNPRVRRNTRFESVSIDDQITANARPDDSNGNSGGIVAALDPQAPNSSNSSNFLYRGQGTTQNNQQ